MGCKDNISVYWSADTLASCRQMDKLTASDADKKRSPCPNLAALTELIRGLKDPIKRMEVPNRGDILRGHKHTLCSVWITRNFN